MEFYTTRKWSLSVTVKIKQKFQIGDEVATVTDRFGVTLGAIDKIYLDRDSNVLYELDSHGGTGILEKYLHRTDNKLIQRAIGIELEFKVLEEELKAIVNELKEGK